MSTSEREAHLADFQRRVDQLKQSGLYKENVVLTSPQQTHVEVEVKQNSNYNNKTTNTRKITKTKSMLNFCSNGYLSLANRPEVKDAAIEATRAFGTSMSSVSWICGTSRAHELLELECAAFLRQQDALLFTSAFDANVGVFQALFGKGDALVCDSLIHASLIDGVRLCRAKKFIFKSNDMTALRAALVQARAAVVAAVDENENSNNDNNENKGKRGKIAIVVDSVFSMDGVVANLRDACALADEFGAFLVVDEAHATGVLGAGGRGGAEAAGVLDHPSLIITTTFGKALGGIGGVVAGPRPIVDFLRQSARTVLFSNSLPPAAVAAARAALRIVRSDEGRWLREQLRRNAAYLRGKLAAHGLRLIGDGHAIVPILIGDAAQAARMAQVLREKWNVFLIAFSYPVVPKNLARIRMQLNASHTSGDIDSVVEAIVKAAHEVGVLKMRAKL